MGYGTPPVGYGTAARRLRNAVVLYSKLHDLRLAAFYFCSPSALGGGDASVNGVASRLRRGTVFTVKIWYSRQERMDESTFNIRASCKQAL